MKSKITAMFGCAMLAWALVGCAHVDLRPEGDPNRVVRGKIHLQEADLLAGAVVTIRLLDSNNAEAVPVVVAEKTIREPGEPPIPFQIEFVADDALLRLGLNLEVRISVGGKLRHYNLNSHVITTSNVADPHEIWANPASR